MLTSDLFVEFYYVIHLVVDKLTRSTCIESEEEPRLLFRIIIRNLNSQVSCCACVLHIIIYVAHLVVGKFTPQGSSFLAGIILFSLV